MNKNIIIAILVVLTAISFVYALFQRTEATKQAALADENAQMALAVEKHTLVQMQECKTEIERWRQITEECARTKK